MAGPGAQIGLELNVDYFAIKISRIYKQFKPHLKTATHGFEKNVLASGHLVRIPSYSVNKPTDAFYIVFNSKGSKQNFMKNSKWLKELKRDHKEAQVSKLDIQSVTYNLKDGFLKPIVPLTFIPDFGYSYRDEEAMMVEYVHSNRAADMDVAMSLCRGVLEENVNCTTLNWRVCNSHVGHMVLANNVAKAFENKGLLNRAIELLELCAGRVDSCTARKSIYPKISLLNRLEGLYKISPNGKEGVLRCLNRVSCILESLTKQRSQLPEEEQKELARHTFAFGLHCIEQNETHLGEGHIEDCIQLLEEESVCRDDAKIKQAAEALVKVVKEGMRNTHGNVRVQETLQTKGLLTLDPLSFQRRQLSDVSVKELEDAFDELTLTAPKLEARGSAPKKEAIKLCDGLKKISSTDIEVEILGGGFKTANIFEIQLFDGCGRQVSWHNTNLQVFFATLESDISTGSSFITVSLNENNEIVKLWVKEVREGFAEIAGTEEKTFQMKTVTFANHLDTFDDNEVESEGILEEESGVDLLSTPTDAVDCVTIGGTDMEDFLGKLKQQLTCHLSQSSNANYRGNEVLVETMVRSVKGQLDWIEEYLEEVQRSCDATTGKFRLPRDVSFADINSKLHKNFLHSGHFNKNLLLRITGELIEDEAKRHLEEKLFERMKIQNTDNDLVKKLKKFFVQQYKENKQDHLEFDVFNDILRENNVTLPFLELGWTNQSNFTKFISDNFSGINRNDFTKFYNTLKTFFTEVAKLEGFNEQHVSKNNEQTNEVAKAEEFSEQHDNKNKEQTNEGGIITVDDENEDCQRNQEGQLTESTGNRTLGTSESLYVGDLPKDMSEEQLMMIFSKYGKVVNVRVKRTSHPTLSPYCFIGFGEGAAVGKALKDQPIMVNGSHKLKIREKKEKTQKHLSPVLERQNKNQSDVLDDRKRATNEGNKEKVLEKQDKDLPESQDQLSDLLSRMTKDMGIPPNYQNPSFRANAQNYLKEATELKKGLDGTPLYSSLELLTNTIKKGLEETRISTPRRETHAEDVEDMQALVEERDMYKNQLYQLRKKLEQEDDSFENLQSLRTLFRLKVKQKKQLLKHNEELNAMQEKYDTLKTDVKKQVREMEEKNELLEKENKTMVAEVRHLKLVLTKMASSASASASASAQNPMVRLSLSSDSSKTEIVLVPADSCGLLPLASVQEHVTNGNVSSIFYLPHTNGSIPVPRAIIPSEGRFHPPSEGWGDREYHVVVKLLDSTQPKQTDIDSPKERYKRYKKQPSSIPSLFQAAPTSPMCSNIPQSPVFQPYVTPPHPSTRPALLPSPGPHNPFSHLSLQPLPELSLPHIFSLLPPLPTTVGAQETWAQYHARLTAILHPYCANGILSPLQQRKIKDSLPNLYTSGVAKNASLSNI